MLWVVDKKVVKHALNVGVALVEVPIRIRFEFGLDDGCFAARSMQRNVLYNAKELLRRFPRLQRSALDAEIGRVADKALVEHLKFSGYAHGDVELYARDVDEREGEKKREGEKERQEGQGWQEQEEQQAAPTIVVARSVHDYKAAARAEQ